METKVLCQFSTQGKNNDTKDPAFTRQSSPLGITPAREVRDTFSAKATTNETFVCRILIFERKEK